MSSNVQALVDDVSCGAERVRIPLVHTPADTSVTLPDFTYHKDYTASPGAAVVINELHRRGLVQWAGSAATADAPDFESLTMPADDGVAGSEAHTAVLFQESNVLGTLSYTPCIEDVPGAPTAMRRCA